MALSQRQLILYTDLVDIYVPINIGTKRLRNNEIESFQYPATPTYSSVPCFRKTVPKIGIGHFYGQEKQQSTTANINTTHFEASTDLGPGYVWQVKTSGDPDENSWEIVSSEPDVNNFKANAQIVHSIKTTKPPGVT